LILKCNISAYFVIFCFKLEGGKIKAKVNNNNNNNKSYARTKSFKERPERLDKTAFDNSTTIAAPSSTQSVTRKYPT